MDLFFFRESEVERGRPQHDTTYQVSCKHLFDHKFFLCVRVCVFTGVWGLKAKSEKMVNQEPKIQGFE